MIMTCILIFKINKTLFKINKTLFIILFAPDRSQRDKIGQDYSIFNKERGNKSNEWV